MDIQPNLRNTEFFRDVEQVELGYMPMESITPPPAAAPIRIGRNVRLGRNVQLKPYNVT
jgi:hypothetical protein